MPLQSNTGDGLHTSMGVDYVIVFRCNQEGAAETTSRFETLVQSLTSVGLDTEVRAGNGSSLLLFVRVGSTEHFNGEVYRSRVQDWLHGIRIAEPHKETKRALEQEPLYEAERLRILYQLITNPRSEGGAGITPREGEWQCVESIFPLHDHSYNKEWIKKWAKSYFLRVEDLDAIRDRLGEKIAFYFAFTQTYFTFLVIPAIFGFSAWLLLGHFSPFYALVNCFWCIAFTEYWKYQETDLAIRWGVKGVSRIQSRRRDFKPETVIYDSTTGAQVPSFPASKRFQRQLLQVPYALVAVLALGTLITTCFGIEIFISEIYNGPFKSILVFLPTVIICTLMPLLTGTLTDIATKLTQYENYENQTSFEKALTQKVFILNFISSYLPIFLTAFVYVPFGSLLMPYLGVFSVTVKPFAENEKQMQVPKSGSTINPQRLRKQVFFFTVTAQIVNLATEVIIPYVKRHGSSKLQEMKDERKARKEGKIPNISAHDPPEEAEFLNRVRKETELTNYDVTTDLREMILQFGYLSLFSVVWPLTGVSFLLNDWVELRADAIKICVEMQRPIPWRADTIGPWLDSLEFLTWVGSLTSAALVYLFSNDGIGPNGLEYSIKGWGLLLCMFLSEHSFLVVRWAVRVALSKLDSPGRQRERRERYMVRRRYFEESLTTVDYGTKTTHTSGPPPNRELLEEVARNMTSVSTSIQDEFWTRQKGWRETATVGSTLILEAYQNLSQSEPKKEL